MRRQGILAGMVLALGTFGCASSRGALPVDAVALATVTSIYLGDFGADDGASAIKERVRLAVARTSQFRVVESEPGADATLSGAVSIQKETIGGVVNYSGGGVLHLVQRSAQKMIWAHEYRDRRLMTAPTESDRGAVAARVANQMVDELVKAAAAKSQ